MNQQLKIECPVENQHLLDIAKKDYEKTKLNKNLHPVFLVANLKLKNYFVTTFFSREFLESYETFKIIE